MYYKSSLQLVAAVELFLNRPKNSDLWTLGPIHVLAKFGSYTRSIDIYKTSKVNPVIKVQGSLLDSNKFLDRLAST
jgi:hypothetical protein